MAYNNIWKIYDIKQAKKMYLNCMSFIHGETIQDLDILSWASYQIRKIVGCTCAGNAGNVFPATDF